MGESIERAGNGFLMQDVASSPSIAGNRRALVTALGSIARESPA